MGRRKAQAVTDTVAEIVRPRRQKETEEINRGVTRRKVLTSTATAAVIVGAGTYSEEIVPLKDRTPKDGK